MLKYLITITIFFLTSSLVLTAQTDQLIGHWEGGLNRLGAIQILRFDIHSQSDSIWATYDDPASAVFNAPFFDLRKINDTLHMNFGYGKFKAVLHKDVNEITGVNAGWNPRLELHMRKYGQKRNPSFMQEDMVIKHEGNMIGASFLKPLKERYPVVVLVHGSGETVRATGYYYSLAYNLAERGVGVLLYDKRGCGKTTGDYSTASFNDLANDAIAAVRYLRSRKDLAITKIGLLGTSQGGWVSYIASKKTKDIQFIVANVGAAVSLFQQDVDRVYYSMNDDGYDKENIDSAVVYSNNYFRFIAGKLSWRQFEPMAKVAGKSSYKEYVFVPHQEKDDDVLWWSRNSYDPAADLSSIGCPVFSMMGENDMLVPPVNNEPLMRKYLTKAGVKFQIKVYPNCGHAMESFSTLKGGEWKFPEKFWIWKKKTPGFYEDIVDWINHL
jgi:uncharacterized protein